MKSQQEADRLFRILFHDQAKTSISSTTGGNHQGAEPAHHDPHCDEAEEGHDDTGHVERRKKSSAFRLLRRSIWSKNDLDAIDAALAQEAAGEQDQEQDSNPSPEELMEEGRCSPQLQTHHPPLPTVTSKLRYVVC